MTPNTLHITGDPTAEFFEAALEDVRQREADEDGADKYVLRLPHEHPSSEC